MAKIIYPSSFLCDCGAELDFSENTIESMIKMSLKKQVLLSDNSEPAHKIYFISGKVDKIICPKLGTVYLSEVI